MGVLTFTTSQVEAILDGRMNSFRQDISDSAHTVGSPQTVLADTEYKITIDALTRNVVTAPAYITSRWDAVNSKVAFPEELDSPTYVCDLSFTFAPNVAAAGVGAVRVYIDDATPKLIREYTFGYKSDPMSVNMLLTWYLGEETGYDAKNDGVYFAVEFDVAGTLYNKGAVIYRT